MIQDAPLPQIQGMLVSAASSEAIQQPSTDIPPVEQDTSKLRPQKPGKHNTTPEKEKVPAKPASAQPQLADMAQSQEQQTTAAADSESMQTPAHSEPTEPTTTQHEHKEVSQSQQPSQAYTAPVSPPRLDADHLNNPAPAYPKLSRRLREEGVVTLDVLILPDGSVGDIRIKQSSGFERLDLAAIGAVKRWRYQPALKGQQAISYWYVQPLSFSLH